MINFGQTRHAPVRALVAALAIALSGCAMRGGQRMISRDRFDYSNAIARTWKEQMLLNMVKQRYMEPPIFLDITQVISQYTFEASASVNAFEWPNGGTAGVASGRWAESPTITFSPLTGDKFIRSLLQPVSPIALLSLVQAGWPIDEVFSIGVRAINGLHAGSKIMLMRRSGDPDFYRLLTLLRELQLTDSFGLRVEKEKSGILAFRPHPHDLESGARAKAIRQLLGLNPEAHEFTVAFGAVAKDDREIAFLTRSMLEILGEAAMGVQVPASDMEEGRATKVPPPAGPSDEPHQFLVHVESSEHRPSGEEAFSAVHYRNHWFWVPDRDLQAKRGLGFLMGLFTMAETGESAAPPVLTISKP